MIRHVNKSSIFLAAGLVLFVIFQGCYKEDWEGTKSGTITMEEFNAALAGDWYVTHFSQFDENEVRRITIDQHSDTVC